VATARTWVGLLLGVLMIEWWWCVVGGGSRLCLLCSFESEDGQDSEAGTILRFLYASASSSLS
jgi:hypothetical protein